jgi:hypothetical protein
VKDSGLILSQLSSRRFRRDSQSIYHRPVQKRLATVGRPSRKDTK